MSTAVEHPGRRRPRPAIRKTILVIHIAASVALMGEVWALVVLNLSATLTGEAGLARTAYRLMERLVFAGGIPLSLTALASGIALALAGGWGLTRHIWLLAKLLLLIAVICVGIFLFDPAGMAAADPPAGARWGQVGAVAAQLVMLLTATTLSVFKPRGRTPWARHAHPGTRSR